MAKLNLTANVLSLESALKLEDIKNAMRWCPDALTVMDDKGEEELFSVAAGTSKGYISPYGITFAAATVRGGKACYTREVAPGTEMKDIAEVVLAEYDKPKAYLEVVEAQVAEALAKVAERRTAIMAELAGECECPDCTPDCPTAQGEE